MKNLSKIMTRLGLAVLAIVVVGAVVSLTAPSVVAQLRAALVKDVDEPGRSPYFSVIQGAGDCSPASLCHFAFDPVPANKRLVITNVDGLFFREPGLIAIVSGVIGCTNCLNKALVNVPTTAFNVGGNTAWSFNEEVFVTYEAGETPRVKVWFNTASGIFQNISLHGYLVDLGV